jgi:outer membrane protein
MAKISVWLLSLFFFQALAAAQESRSLTMEQAIEVAVTNNRNLASARLDMEKAGDQVREAYGLAMPTLSFGGTYTRALKVPVIFLTIDNKVTTIKLGLPNTYQMGFTASQVLFNSSVFTGVGTAKIFQKVSREAYRASYNSTVSNVKRAFYNVLLARQVDETSKASLGNAEDNLANVRTLHKQGMISDYDLIRAEVQVENIRPSVLESEKNVLVATNTLKITMGLEAENAIDVKGELGFIEADSSLIDPAKAIANNASLLAMHYQREVNEAFSAIRRSEYMPTVSAFGNYQWQAQTNALGVTGKDFIASSQAGISLTINLFNGFQTTARLQQAKVDERKIDQQIEAAREILKTQLQSVALRLQEARKRIFSQQRTVELAEKSYKIAKVRYQTGSATLLEINDADLALLRARLNRIQAIYDYAMAKTDLEEAVSYHIPK